MHVLKRISKNSNFDFFNLSCFIYRMYLCYICFIIDIYFFFKIQSKQVHQVQRLTMYLSAQTSNKTPQNITPNKSFFHNFNDSKFPRKKSPQTSVVTSQSKISDSSFSKTNITVPTIKPSNPADATTKKAKMDSSGNCFYIVQM